MMKRNKEGDEALRKKQAKMRFKRLLRVALANHQWITELDDHGITLNVKKNVAMLVRKKHKTGILTMAQKGLLATAHHTRSIAERKRLCTIVAGLGCFTQVPPKIRARLVPHLHFMVIGSGRTLMKEGDVPICVYFVVSGEVEMSKNVLNKITRKYELKPEAFFGPGDWIGEIELLEDNLRMNTYKAQTNCEILVLDDSDFISLLMPYVQKVWFEKKKAIASLSYLRFMNESQIISACKFALLRQYDPLDTIYPDEKDNIQYVYFVLSGNCVLLQCLHMKVANVKGEVQYTLTKMEEVDSEQDVDEDKPEPFDVRELLRSTSSIDEAGHSKKKVKRKAEFAKIEANCKLINAKIHHSDDDVPPPEPPLRHSTLVKKIYGVSDIYGDYADYLCPEEAECVYFNEGISDDLDKDIEENSSESPNKRLSDGKVQANKMISKAINEEEASGESEGSTEASESSPSVRSTKKKRNHQTYSTHFIDVASMSFGGLFGIGEKADHRVVMARTTVQCLQIPRYWLMEDEQNPGHMWQRMRFYLERCIPSRESLFHDFIKTRKWADFKDDCVEPFTHSFTNPTKIEDIPIIIRIVESKQPGPNPSELRSASYVGSRIESHIEVNTESLTDTQAPSETHSGT